MSRFVEARHVAVALVLGSTLCARVASAQGEQVLPVRLVWTRDDAAQACPSAEATEADVTQRLGFSPFASKGPAARVIEVVVSGRRGVWEADVTVREADGSVRGSRHVESRAADCQPLASAAALAIALMIDPELLARASDNPRPSAPARREPPQEAPPSSPAPPPEPVRPAEKSARRGALAAGVALSFSMLPRVAMGPTLRGELELPVRLVVAVEAYYFTPQRLEAAGALGSLGMTALGAGVCYRAPLVPRLDLAACASALVGALTLAVQSPDPLSVDSRPWVGWSSGLRLAYGAGPVTAEIAGGLVAHLFRRDFVVARQAPERTESFFEEPRFGALSSLTLGARF